MRPPTAARFRARLARPHPQPSDPGSAAAAAEAPKEEKTSFDLKLDGFDAAAKIKVIKEIRAVTDLGLKEAKELVRGTHVFRYLSIIDIFWFFGFGARDCVSELQRAVPAACAGWSPARLLVWTGRARSWTGRIPHRSPPLLLATLRSRARRWW